VLRIDPRVAQRAIELVRRADVLGMTDAEREPFAGKLDAFEAEIERREADRKRMAPADWYERMISFRIRRMGEWQSFSLPS